MHQPQAIAPATPNSLAVLRVLNLCELFERSATLDGAIPLRAAYAAATHHYDAQVEALVTQGFLTRDGYWHRELQAGFVHPTATGLRLWTGLLVQPSHDTWLPARIAETVAADPDRSVPPFLDFDTAALADCQTWLTVELAVLTVFRPLRDHPEPGQAFFAFYAAKYSESNSKGTPTGAYRKTLGREAIANPDEPATFELLSIAGLVPPSIETFTRFARADGFASHHPDQARLAFAVARTICPFHARFDGHALRDVAAIEQWVAFAHANRGPQRPLRHPATLAPHRRAAGLVGARR